MTAQQTLYPQAQKKFISRTKIFLAILARLLVRFLRLSSSTKETIGSVEAPGFETQAMKMFGYLTLR
jgi:hypothetical protein